ncbi:T9SS type B sorting domain-containing protein [Maribacter ulvicola]|uniref:Gliding motility-associated C-terminal domain-containing protein n=1 Tax=Maribacter ulvicola TaxID=228959 RepID=A0A1N6PKY1_9FLAO|nr:T9SS type B sorting domain-containing protein [Maribacter ulvicola]SIQ05044.1 gliding motility-associated C-terminal domain-containing protein [Maribacter ulvicola]
MKKFISIALIIISTFGLHAQKEAAIWYFGENAGLDFNSGTTVALTDSAMNTEEGCSTVSDSNGNLLFYTDGSTVWDRNHNAMPNGTGLFGDVSSTQSSIVVPLPESPNLFYIFTVFSSAILPGLNFSILDMNLNGGLGDVTTQKNLQLEPMVSEKLTAVLHENGRDIWVLAHRWDSDAYLAYLVTPAGLNPIPVESNVGEPHRRTFPDGDWNFAGYLKASPDGRKLAGCIPKMGLVELFDFNTTTGVICNPLKLDEDLSKKYYGVEFSPSGRFLYVVDSRLGLPRYSRLYQYDIEAPDIPGSQVLVHDNGGNLLVALTSLQLGIDGKIYACNFNNLYISSIENPDEKGVACNFIGESVWLGGQRGLSGLPQFIQSFFLVNLEVENLCFGNTTEFKVKSTKTIDAITWDFGDGNTSVIEEPTYVYTTPGVYTVSVEVTTGADTEISTKEITIEETPIAVAQANIEVCVTEDSYTLDLSTLNTAILGTQNPSDFTVTYFSSQTDADANSNPLALNYDFPLGSTAVYARVSNRNNTACFDTTQFNILAQQEPTLGTISDWTICDDNLDGFYTFDLTEKNTDIFNGQDEAVFDVAYFASQADADAGTNPLPLNYTNSLAVEEIFTRLQNTSHTDCYKTESFTIEVSAGVVVNTPNNLELCDDDNDGFATFTLSDTETEIIGTQNSSSLAISYHTTLADAESGSNEVDNDFTNTTAYIQSMYARVQNTSDSSCYDITSFDLIVFDSPQIQIVTDWNVCDDDNDELSLFDLNQKSAEILGNQNANDFTVNYYETLAEANLAQNDINDVYQNTSNPQTIYYSIENNSTATCRVTDSFEITVNDTPFAQAPLSIILCDDETGNQSIDLTQKDVEILDSQAAADFNVRYYTSQADAENDSNAVNGEVYSTSQAQETIYARVERTDLQSCFAITSFEIIINPLPQPNLDERYVICPDSPALVIDGGDFESWSWQNSSGIELNTTRNFNVSDLGAYQLTVSQTANGVRCENSQSFEVLSSGAPETMTVEINGFSDQIDITINATGTGPFEYSVDGKNYQTSNEFVVFPGEHTMFVRDLLECRVLSEEVVAIGYQRFFTPNGDGSNEYWNIIGGELHPESQVYIYDRYGKLLKQISPNSKGWDGTSNGILLPESDYWFKYVYSDNQIITGHFTLKR